MTHARRRYGRFFSLLIALALVASVSACGGGKKGGGSAGGNGEEDVGDPVRGGSISYGLEAETNDGWCLPESQLAISGIVVARAIFDTLTAPNAEGDYVPYLAESVEPNDTFDEWTITLRDGVKFHDGSDLTAEVVKNNLDAYRGKYEGRSPLLFLFVLQNIESVEVTADMEVTVTTTVPWVGFPGFLHASGRLGMVGQAQLDDQENCATELIGTGPFKIESWDKGTEFVASANKDYWQEAPDGKPYPYLDEIRFVPIVEGEQRVNALESGDIDLMHGSSAQDMETLESLEEGGAVRTRQSDDFAEVAFIQVNNSKPPLDDVRVRRALSLAVDRENYKEVINLGRFTNASGPFAPGSIGYLEDTGWPTEADVDEAKSLIAEYEDDVGPLRSITYQATPGTVTQEVAVFVQQALNDIGVELEIETVQQDTLIDNAIAGEFDIMGFRNYPGGDPDELFVWFNGDSPANFSRFKDEEVNRLLAAGRSEPDPETRKGIYEDLNRRMADQAFSLWANWTTWMVAGGSKVYGYTEDTLPLLPGDSANEPFPGLATGHPLHGLWVTEE